MDDGESINSAPTLAARVAAVQNDITHLLHRVDQVESSVKETRDELKSDMHRIEERLKSDLHGDPDNVRLQSLLDDIKEVFRDLKSDNTEVRSMRTALRHDRRVLCALCGTVIVSMIALLAKGVVY